MPTFIAIGGLPEMTELLTKAVLIKDCTVGNFQRTITRLLDKVEGMLGVSSGNVRYLR